MIGIIFWILILGILWRVPEFKFLAFFILANNVLYTLMIGWSMTPDQWSPFLVATAIGDLIFAAIATPVILFRKWQRAQKPGGGHLDREMERIRADIAARDAQQQQPPQS
ncbi:MAG: hypothetical protein J0L81_01690 [Caulobacterales bacterium]|nr:hypothetical protein [Caulobacterales bacterium]